MTLHLANSSLQLLNRVVFHSHVTTKQADLPDRVSSFSQLVFKHSSASDSFPQFILKLFDFDKETILFFVEVVDVGLGLSEL